MVCFTLEWALKIDSEEYLRGLWAERGGGEGGWGLVEAEAAKNEVSCMLLPRGLYSINSYSLATFACSSR